MRRLPFLVLAALTLALAACGGGGDGGDEDAFCDDLEVLSEQVIDGDLADDNGLEDVTDTVNDLVESAAEGEQLDAVRTVGEEVADADPDQSDDTAETIQDELGDFAEDCDIDEDEFAIPATTATTGTIATADTVPTSDTTSTSTAGDVIVVFAREPVPGDIAAEFAALAQACFDGDMASCDELFNTTPSNSVDEAYGDSCAGRIADGRRFDLECIDVFPGPQPFGADVVDQSSAQACFDGDMNVCDAMLGSDNQADQQYGFFCGGRIDATAADTDALCVAIFGPVAFT
jgi:hypothetical protein